MEVYKRKIILRFVFITLCYIFAQYFTIINHYVCVYIYIIYR